MGNKKLGRVKEALSYIGDVSNKNGYFPAGYGPFLAESFHGARANARLIGDVRSQNGWFPIGQGPFLGEMMHSPRPEPEPKPERKMSPEERARIINQRAWQSMQERLKNRQQRVREIQQYYDISEDEARHIQQNMGTGKTKEQLLRSY